MPGKNMIWDDLFIVTMPYVCGMLLLFMSFIAAAVYSIKSDFVSLIMNCGSMCLGAGLAMGKDYLNSQIKNGKEQ